MASASILGSPDTVAVASAAIDVARDVFAADGYALWRVDRERRVADRPVVRHLGGVRVARDSAADDGTHAAGRAVLGAVRLRGRAGDDDARRDARRLRAAKASSR